MVFVTEVNKTGLIQLLITQIITHMTAMVSGKKPGKDINESLSTCTLMPLPGNLEHVQPRGQPAKR